MIKILWNVVILFFPLGGRKHNCIISTYHSCDWPCIGNMAGHIKNKVVKSQRDAHWLGRFTLKFIKLLIIKAGDRNYLAYITNIK